MIPDPEQKQRLELPPLALYIHLPWCVRKCPYCDFNSHVADEIPAEKYYAALKADLETELPDVWGRSVSSIFFGGGTPSLFSAEWIADLLNDIRSLLRLTPDVEISLEANPGTTEHDSFAAYKDAGINRVSLGVQSFSDDALERIGRIHGRTEIKRSIEAIHCSGLTNFNIDLMYALPGQTARDAESDIIQAIACNPGHISHYQLTLEPNTAFAANPPELPDADSAWEMQQRCAEKLSVAGFDQYEISAWAKKGSRCRHNLNYWRYGDFLGIGAGAHSKVTLPTTSGIRRRVRQRHPKSYLKAVESADFLSEDRLIGKEERVFEFFLNQLRLFDGVRKKQFTPRTGIAWNHVSDRVETAIRRGLLSEEGSVLKPTGLGWRFINETQTIFLPPSRAKDG